ncbi:MAG: nucleotidyltransferase domain-containing protein, partial [Oscillospiraceae bacterium]|nr:nucleotidyltransferase domain-containing protein [Oscillospiraceae bacterium]
VTVPEPEIYILQKLLINPLRKSEDKKEKDMQSVRELLPYINGERLKYIFDRLSKKQQIVIKRVCKVNFIRILPE